MRTKLFFLVFGTILITHCDKGLSPIEEVTGIKGTVHVKNWPSADSLVDFRIVAFQEFPPENIYADILSNPPKAYVYPGIGDTTKLPLYVSEFQYQFELPPGKYEYVVVAQQYGPLLTQDWQAVGQYDTNQDSLPTPVTVADGQLSKDIDIDVDFDNLPIQPF